MNKDETVCLEMHQENPIIRIANALASVSIDDFDNRLKLQKIGFLAQELGADTGFTFNWYRRGPYSPSLTRMLYSAEELGALKLAKLELNASEKRIVTALKDLLGNNIENPRALELIASVWYLLPRPLPSGREVDQILELLLEHKPQFTREELREALQKVLRFLEKWRAN